VMVAGVAAFFAISGPPRWLNGFERVCETGPRRKTPCVMT
jgi:hypothetical protein